MKSSVVNRNEIANLICLGGVAFAVAIAFLFPLASKSLGVSPAPDGGYAGQNTAEGDGALFSLTTTETNGLNNTASGFNALYYDTTGNSNTATGVGALGYNTVGSANTATGVDALLSNTDDYSNTANGYEALYRNTRGIANTASGVWALYSNTTGLDNTANGYQALYSNETGSNNTATGFNALLSNTSDNNTADGNSALISNTTGSNNTAIGFDALSSNLTGYENTANGVYALPLNTIGFDDTANGFQALYHNTTGKDNTADGVNALQNNTTGSNNIAVGYAAGRKLTTGSNNIDIGANVVANGGEANTIRIGKQGTQKSTLIAGIAGTPISGNTVVVNSAGKLGVATSSARFKEQIKPIDKASEALLKLKPVTFRYKEDLDPDKIPRFGLIAEEVEKVDPDLITRDESGRPITVRYEAVNAMLLNEFLKEHQKVEEQARQAQAQAARLAKQDSIISQQQTQITALAAGLKAQADQIQKVSIQLQLSKPPSQVVVNNR